MTNFINHSNYFYGNKVSDYGIEHGFVDYRTFAKAFDAVMNNYIMGELENKGFYFDLVSGGVDNSEEIEELENKIEELENKIEEPTAEEIEELEELRSELEELENNDGMLPEVYQWFIVDDIGAEILQDFNEILFYCEELDMYIWGVDHWGTSWDYVLTNIKIELQD